MQIRYINRWNRHYSERDCSEESQLEGEMLRKLKLISLAIFITGQAFCVQAGNAVDAVADLIINAPIGSGDGQIGYESFGPDAWVEPAAIAIDSGGNVYVADTLYSRIQKFSKDGIFLLKIIISTPLQLSNEFVNDVVVDNDDSLYVLIKNAKTIYKFGSNGNLIKRILLKDSVNSDKISVDNFGNIYLFSEITRRLYKIGGDGSIQEIWAGVETYFLEPKGTLYVPAGDKWRRYSRDGKDLGLIACADASMSVDFPMSEGGGCHFPPQFIDRDGNRYFIINSAKSKTNSETMIFNHKGEYLKRLVLPFRADLYPQSNLIKFGADGAFYSVIGHMSEGFKVMRIKLQ